MFRYCQLQQIRHPDEIKDWIPIQWLEDWDAYAMQCGYREDVQFGLITYILANQNRSSNDSEIPMESLMPYYEGPVVNEEDLALKIKSMMREKLGGNPKP